MPEMSYLFDYAFCGTEADFSKTLDSLSKLAENEKWSFDGDKPYSILKKYILGTFSQCQKQGKVLLSSDGQYSCFNTGLLTQNGNDIVGLFEKNKRADAQPWVLKRFLEKSHRDFLDVFSELPQLATYTTNFDELYFNPECNVVVNTDHILDDNWERIESVVKIGKHVMKTLLVGVIEEAKMRIKRNLRLVVPQFYKDEIMYLVPIRIPTLEGNYETMALAVEKTSTNQYRANTIFTKEMAYEKARLLMKPESNWLID